MDTWFLSSSIAVGPVFLYGQKIGKMLLFLVPLALAACLCYAFYPSGEQMEANTLFGKHPMVESLFSLNIAPQPTRKGNFFVFLFVSYGARCP